MTKTLISVLAVAPLALVASVAWSQAGPVGNAAAGQQKVEMCTGCHGIDGWRTAFPEVYKVPKLGGQHSAYIVKALQEYRAQERAHPSMRAIAATLSDQDIADVAAYYGGANPQTATK